MVNSLVNWGFVGHNGRMTLTQTVQPTVIRSTDGAWLATAGPQAPFRAGAWGDTEEQARSNLRTAVERMQRALDVPG
jgi:hypothetical protein